MTLSRREFLNLFGSFLGGWALAWLKPADIGEIAQSLLEKSALEGGQKTVGVANIGAHDGGTAPRIPRSAATVGSGRSDIAITPDSQAVLDEIGYFNDISPAAFVFDEHKYSAPKRELEIAEWSRTNRHLPIKIYPGVINKPGERSPQELKQVVEYTQFNSPRYVAAPGERASMCNIAAWDWSRALRLHLPHWIDETEMSANMLFRWISHSQAGGVYGEGWQPVKASAAQILANLGIPVFALAENSVPGRHGHVALLYPQNVAFQADRNLAGIYFATVSNGRSRGGNGIKSLQSTFRRLKPTYFVHKDDFILYKDS